MHMDNSAVLSLSRDFASSNKTWHIERRHFMVREYQHKGFINTVKVATADNWADVFTKNLTRVPFERFIRGIMNLARIGAVLIRPSKGDSVSLQRPVYGHRESPRSWN